MLYIHIIYICNRYAYMLYIHIIYTHMYEIHIHEETKEMLLKVNIIYLLA